MRWQDVLADKQLQDLPYKIELNRWGQIVMSPAKPKHSFYQGRILQLLATLAPGGQAVPELAVLTSDNVKVVDAAWISDGRIGQIVQEDVASIAPEICVEIRSASNSEAEMQAKRELYLEAGATEFWICSNDGRISFFDREGQRPGSTLVPNFPDRITL